MLSGYLREAFGHHIVENSRREVCAGHRAQILAAAGADRDGLVFDVAVADDEHIRNLAERRLADFLADLLASRVNLHADACAFSSPATLSA